ncbi:dUTP diphosphatase [Alteribacter aurantiacus]|uniref:dUTP diphosphatase n=1 Tax=Alteribacter aurantiacus TaxID=254410 RepID=UPI00041F1666|nr:dUTP diphosphatase [Alteribacter aurantiacus]
MDFTRLFEMQKALDKHIETKHGLTEESLVERKLLAFSVELGELANETRCFKFWSEKPPSEKRVVLEEYVDGVHFLMSIGIEFGFDDHVEYLFPEDQEASNEQLTEDFLEIQSSLVDVQKTRDFSNYKAFFNAYLRLGAHLGFTEEDLLTAYLDKNEVNYKRQQEGY